MIELLTISFERHLASSDKADAHTQLMRVYAITHMRFQELSCRASSNLGNIIVTVLLLLQRVLFRQGLTISKL